MAEPGENAKSTEAAEVKEYYVMEHALGPNRIRDMLVEKDAEIEKITGIANKRLCESCLESHPVTSDCPPHEVRTTGSEWYRANVREKDTEIERLKQQLAEASEYLVELRGEWSWKKDGSGNRNKKRYDELASFIDQLAEVTNQEEANE